MQPFPVLATAGHTPVDRLDSTRAAGGYEGGAGAIGNGCGGATRGSRGSQEGFAENSSTRRRTCPAQHLAQERRHIQIALPRSA